MFVRGASLRRGMDTPSIRESFSLIGPTTPRYSDNGRMLEVVVRVFPFSPPAFQASLQTSAFQARNRIIGIAMPLIKKCDVNDYLAARRRARLHPLKSPGKPDAAGLSVPAPGVAGAKQAGFAKDFLGEHSVAVKPIAPGSKEGLGAL